MPRSDAASIAAVAGELRAGILSGAYPAGAKLPTARALAERHWPLSEASATKALRMLRDEGLITLEKRTGSVVLPRYPYRVEADIACDDEDWRAYAQALKGALAEDASRSGAVIGPPAVRAARGSVKVALRVSAPSPAMAVTIAWAVIVTGVRGNGDAWDLAGARLSAVPA